MNGSNLAKSALLPNNATRLQNSTAATAIKTGAGTLWTLVIASADAAVQTVTVADDSLATFIVLQIPAHDTRVIAFGGLPFTTSLKLTNSATTLDVLALYD